MSNQTNELKNMMASFFQMNTASTSRSGSLPSNTVANPKGELKALPLEVVLFLMDLPFLFLPHSLIQRDPLHLNIPYPSRMIKQKQQEKDEVKIHKFWHMFKQLHINITLVDAQIIMPKYHKMLKALLSNKEKLQELENTPLTGNCSATARALIDVHGEEMILRDGDERVTLNTRHDTSSYSNQPQKESINLINVFTNTSEDFLVDLFSTNQPSGNPTFSSHPELTLPEVKDDDIDSSLKDSIDQSKIADLNNNLVDSIPEMFTDEHALDYSSPPLYNAYDDDLFEVVSDTENVYDDPFDSKGEKIKEFTL
nr:reverse transcriptase domain-containing protein [Tanacetum cinerariifolium]